MLTGGHNPVARRRDEVNGDFAGVVEWGEGFFGEVGHEGLVPRFDEFGLVAVVVEEAGEGADDRQEDGPVAGGEFGAEVRKSWEVVSECVGSWGICGTHGPESRVYGLLFGKLRHGDGGQQRRWR